MTVSDVHGPIDFLMIEFPGDRVPAETGQALLDLVERGVVRLYDLMVISKDKDGAVQTLELAESPGAEAFRSLAGAHSGLLGDDDLLEAGAAMLPGTVAAVIVYENSWAIPFVAAAGSGGGQMIATSRIPAADVSDVLDQLEPIS
ncbi:hypothetical protein GCM10009789_02880 [Kribbella sancticallisti]|uniref:DUF1269 domain-containing protein n=1 Tax=Kribbella sancticallisti TaxID=460087 RepID=A0ABP4MYX8_9ACTN